MNSDILAIVTHYNQNLFRWEKNMASNFCTFNKEIVKETLLLFVVVYIHLRISAVPKKNLKRL